jgi:cytochrome c peroxidase
MHAHRHEKRLRAGRNASLVFASFFLCAQTSAQPSGAHGAMAMDRQMQRLHDLLGERDVTAAPAGVDPVMWRRLYVPEDNRMTRPRVDLGKKLYFDTRLSADDTVACATCHDVSRHFTDQRRVSEGIDGQLGMRNAPTTMNAFLLQTQFWDGRAPTLEDQAGLPPVNPIEMGQPDRQAVIDAIKDLPEYRAMFEEAYGSAPNFDDMVKAIASFERTLAFLESPFDRFVAGDDDAISDQAKQGWTLFNGKARCVSCHALNPSNPSGSDSRFHNIGVAARAQNFEDLARRALEALGSDSDVQAVDELALQTDLSELGRFLVTKDRADIGAFKTEQLRNIALTAPYMHDGSMPTLWDVMDHYNKGGEPNPYLDGGIEPLALSESEINAVVAFMFALTDDRFADDNRRMLAQQQALARESRPFRDEAMAQREVLPYEMRVFGQPTLKEQPDSGLESGEQP